MIRLDSDLNFFLEPILPSLGRLKRGYHSLQQSHGPTLGIFRAGVVQDVDQSRTDPKNSAGNTARELIWTSNHSFQAWTCSRCEWNYPLPTLLTESEARTAYDRLAKAQFHDHDCAEFHQRLAINDGDSFTAQIRKLVSKGFKPKDAADLMLQEVALEYRHDPKAMARAKSEADDFLRRVKAGLI